MSMLGLWSLLLLLLAPPLQAMAATPMYEPPESVAAALAQAGVPAVWAFTVTI